MRSKIGRCRITTFRQNTDFIVGLTPDLHVKQRGFTLIELLVVVLIIGILAAVALPQYNLAVAKSRYTQALALGKAIIQAEEAYDLANGSWTDELDQLAIDIPGYDANDNKRAYFNGGYCVADTSKTVSCLMQNTASFASFINDGKRENHCFFETGGQQTALYEKVCAAIILYILGPGGKAPSDAK